MSKYLDLSYSQARSRLLESESDRLQREVDNFTHRLEQQRRRNASLEDQVLNISREVKTRRDNLQKTLPSIKEERKLEARIKTLENNLEKETVKLNDIQAGNKTLRDKIDILRREKRAYLEMFEAMENELIEKARRAERCNSEHLESTKQEDRYKDKMLKLKAQAEGDIKGLQSRFSQMQSEIEDDRKRQTQVIRDIAGTLMTPTSKTGREDAVDPHTSLEVLYNKWVNACKERKKVVEQYHRNIKILSEAFNQIREATGIDDIDEMVTAFIKSEEQNYTLYSYVNSLNTELDALEEKHAFLAKHYEQMRSMMDQEHSNNIAVASELNSQINELKEEQQVTLQEIERMKNELSRIKDPVEEMVKTFEECEFDLEMTKKLTRDDSFCVNEQNIEPYLAELEEYLNLLVDEVAKCKKMQPINIANITQDFRSVHDGEKNASEVLKNFLETDNILEENEVEDYIPLSRDQFENKKYELYTKKANHEIS